MKAKEVLERLNITRPTLTKYVKQGLIEVDNVVNGQYNYNEESVNKLLDKNWRNKQVRKQSKSKVPSISAQVNSENNLETAEIQLDLNSVKIVTREQLAIEGLLNIITDLVSISEQLAQMRLLTANSVAKLNSIKGNLKTIKEEYKL